MKNILLTLITIITISCKAQTVPLDAKYWESPTGTYIKDTFNEMNKYTGTWQFATANDTLTVTIQKKTHVYDGEYYFDLLIGEYRYVSNGVEIVNTLPLLSNSNFPVNEHYISGQYIYPNNLFPSCTNCNINEKRFKLSFGDPDRLYLSLSLVLKHIPVSIGEPEKMKAILISNSGVILPDANSPAEARVPYGEYTMTKQ